MAPPDTAEKSPNVLFVLIDDLGWRDLACQGSTFYETPNVDRLADEGVRFTRAYASCPVCSPTRASLLTGKYPARVGITQWIGGHFRGRMIGAPYFDHLPLSEVTLARALKEHGYRTYHVGKWHLGDAPYWPEHHGFDVNVGGCHWGHPWHGYTSPYQNPALADGPEGEYLTDRLTDEAIQLVEANGTDPFFLYLCYYSVHTPIQAPEDLVARYARKAESTGITDRPAYETGARLFFLENQPPRPVTRRVVQNNPAYAAMIARLDWNIGRLLATLDRLDKRDDTIVVFYSDNGGYSNSPSAPTSNLPLRDGKSYVYEGGIREPCIIRWPGHVPAGTTCDQSFTTPDFYPTILECCGVPPRPEQHVDGESFKTSLADPGATRPRGPMFWHYPHYNGIGAIPAACVIDGDWKLIQWLESGALELYNLAEDEGEQEDLAGSYPETRERLLALLRAWHAELAPEFPRPNPNFPAFLAEEFVHASGRLDEVAGGSLTLQTQLTPQNPQLYDVPLADFLEEYLAQALVLQVGERVRVGRLGIDDAGRVVFHDTHAERADSLADLARDLVGAVVRLRAWKDVPVEVLSPEERARYREVIGQPHVHLAAADADGEENGGGAAILPLPPA